MSTCRRCGGSGKEPDLQEIGGRIRDARVNAGLTLRELARRLDMSPVYISDIENGNREIQGDKAQRLMTHLGIRSGGEHG